MERAETSTGTSTPKVVVISLDVEECDIPCEYGAKIGLPAQLEISARGLARVMDLLRKEGVSATFYTTGIYAQQRPDDVRHLAQLGEIACHGYSHTGFEEDDLGRSLDILRSVSAQPVVGFRMPRMQEISSSLLEKNGIRYNASSNPTWIPGRYCGLKDPRRPYLSDGGVIQFPASVTQWVRFPLFWISAHVLPYTLYKSLLLRTFRHDGYLHLYFHPWEFSDDLRDPSYRIPGYIRKRCGMPMLNFLKRLISDLKGEGCTFKTASNFLQIL